MQHVNTRTLSIQVTRTQMTCEAWTSVSTNLRACTAPVVPVLAQGLCGISSLISDRNQDGLPFAGASRACEWPLTAEASYHGATPSLRQAQLPFVARTQRRLCSAGGSSCRLSQRLPAPKAHPNLAGSGCWLELASQSGGCAQSLGHCGR